MPAVLTVGARHGASYSEHEGTVEEEHSVHVDSGVRGRGAKMGCWYTRGPRIVVPRAARKKIKEFLHLSHLGERLTYQGGVLRYWLSGGF